MKTNFRRRRLVPALFAAGLGALAAGAANAEISTTVSGYGTVGAVVTNKSDLEFRQSWQQSVGAGSHPDFGVDTRFGLQGVMKFNDQFNITAQAVAKRQREDATPRSNNDLNLGFDWFFAQYSPMSNLSLRAGRVVTPAFLISDSRNVGYSQPWLRAPQEVYAGMPVTNLDGVQAIWRIPISSAMLTITPSYGRSSLNFEVGGVQVSQGQPLVFQMRSTDAKAINVQLEWDDWTFRYGVIRARVPWRLNQFSTLSPFMGYVTEPMVFKDKFTGVGVQYDNGKAIVMSEIAQRRQPDVPASIGGTSTIGIPNDTIYSGFIAPIGQGGTGLGGTQLARSTGAYVAGGWHFGPWLPMLIYGKWRDEKYHYSVHSWQASLRYDFATNLALKAQVGRHFARDQNTFVIQDPPESNRKVNVLSVALDFVF